VPPVAQCTVLYLRGTVWGGGQFPQPRRELPAIATARTSQRVDLVVLTMNNADSHIKQGSLHQRAFLIETIGLVGPKGRAPFYITHSPRVFALRAHPLQPLPSATARAAHDELALPRSRSRVRRGCMGAVLSVERARCKECTPAQRTHTCRTGHRQGHTPAADESRSSGAAH